LLALRVHVGLLQIRQASPRLRIKVRGELRLSIRDKGHRGCEQNYSPPVRGWGKGHRYFLPSSILLPRLVQSGRRSPAVEGSIEFVEQERLLLPQGAIWANDTVSLLRVKKRVDHLHERSFRPFHFAAVIRG